MSKILDVGVGQLADVECELVRMESLHICVKGPKHTEKRPKPEMRKAVKCSFRVDGACEEMEIIVAPDEALLMWIGRRMEYWELVKF